MKTNKKVFIDDREKRIIRKQKSIEKITRKISNIFWNLIDFLSCKIEKIAKLYESSISGEYVRENKIFNIPEKSNILHIGTGAYPITAITLAKNNGFRIESIDKNPKSVALAREIIRKKKLHEKIRIGHGNGINYPLEKFDTIIISGCAMPKMEILDHVFNNAKPNSRIIVRELYATSKTVKNFIKSHQGISLEKIIKNQPSTFLKPFGWQSLYLTKR